LKNAAAIANSAPTKEPQVFSTIRHPPSAIRNGLSRRDWLRMTAAGVASTSMTGWLPVLATRAAEQKARAKSCIVLWMDGGPPHVDTVDPKPEGSDSIFKPIATAVPGIQVTELFPHFAKLTEQAAIIRGMSTIEAEHLRANVHLRTGYRDGQGGLTYPALGSIVSAELGDPEFPLPSYVAIHDRRERSHGPGFLGTNHQPMYVHNPARGVENLKAPGDARQLDGRMSLLEELERGFARSHQAPLSQDHHSVYERSLRLMRAEKAKAFDISQEPADARTAYGDSRFGQGCLLARRLIETGVKFVEVSVGGWDTHFENNEAVKKLSAVVDPVMSTLVKDLKDRGLLESTLVVWMGEFGRTPKHKNKGRDHYAKAWSTMFIGGGIKAGQVVGKTDKEGATVVERPVSTPDFMATICQVLGIDYTKKSHPPGGRSIPLVEKGANPIKELLA
jgi:hypothetical protein